MLIVNGLDIAAGDGHPDVGVELMGSTGSVV